jgi:hypothetical protein
MILVLEANQKGEIHSIFNSSMLIILMKAFPDEDILFIADHKHLQAVLQNLRNNKQNLDHLHTRRIFLSSKNHIAKIYWLPRILMEFVNTYNALKIGKRQNCKFVFICSIFPSAQYFYKVVKPLFRKVKVLIALHGELEMLTKKKDKGQNFWGKILNKSFRMVDQEARYLVLGDNIKENLLALTSINKEAIFSIMHPYFFHDYINSFNRTQHEKPIKIGYVGVMQLHKNSNRLFSLANEFKQQITQHVIEFKAIGPVHKDLMPFANSYVLFRPGFDMLSREEFEKEVSGLDYAIYFYDTSWYNLTASGALFDAIDFYKPVISLKSSYFQEIFKRGGEMGYLVNDMNEMKELLDRIIVIGDPKYDQFVDNMKKFKQTYSLENIGKDFELQIHHWIYGGQ